MDGVCRDERSEKVRTHGFPVYTILHSEIGNETLWKHIYIHTDSDLQIHIRSTKHSHPHSKQKCLETPPVLSWIHLYFITGFKISSYSQCPPLPPQPNKASKDARIVFQLS